MLGGILASIGLALALPLGAVTAPAVQPLGAYQESLSAPARVATDAAGNLYVADPSAGQVVVFDAFGRISRIVSGLAGPLGLAVDQAGRIYVAEEYTGSVSVFDAQWRRLDQLGAGEGEFALPNYLALDDDNKVYVSDSTANEIRVYQGVTLVLRFGATGTNAGQFRFPAGLCLGTNAELFVVDQYNDRVQVFDRRGGFRRRFSLVTSLGGMGLPMAGGRSQGILSDKAGRLYVADAFQGLIRVFDEQGTYLGPVGAWGEGPGQFRLPQGLALDPFNRLFVASLNNRRVEILGLEASLHLTMRPAARQVPVGATVAYSVIPEGGGPYSFQWYKGATPLSDGGKLAGAATAVLTLTGVDLSDNSQYYVTVTGPGGVWTSAPATLTVLIPPTIVAFPTNQTVPCGATVALNVMALGDAPVFQWKRNGIEIPGATGSTLLLPNVQPEQAGNYSVTVQNPVGAAASPVSLLTVYVPPPAPSLELITVIPGAGLQFTLLGEMGYTYAIDACSNLLDWITLTNVVNNVGALEVLVPDLAETTPHRFFRVRWTP